MKGYRTFIIALVFAVLGVVEQSADVFGDNSGLVLMVAGIVMAAMRQITNTPPRSGGGA